jgi:plasmid rolling circle replication initiator protein Rep
MCKNELKDYSSTGRKRPWKKHKLSNQKVVNALHILQYKDKAHKIEQCANGLEFGICPDGHGQWLKKAYFCHDRVCSLCNWRKALFLYHQFDHIAHKTLELYSGTKFIFATFTVKNCRPEDLSKTITHMNEAFSNRFLRYKWVKLAYKGVFRSLEVTYNAEEDNLHPHIHAVVAVSKSYFRSRYYIRQSDLCELWGRALKAGYTPICNVKKVRPKKRGVNTVTEEIRAMDREMLSIADAAGEVAKYAVKVGDVLSPTIVTTGKYPDSPGMIEAKLRLRSDPHKQAEVLGYLIDGLYHRRLVSYTGIFKAVYQALKCKDVEDSNLILMPGEEPVCRCKVCQSELVQLHYIWNGQGYFERTKEKETHIDLNHKNKKRRKKSE